MVATIIAGLLGIRIYGALIGQPPILADDIEGRGGADAIGPGDGCRLVQQQACNLRPSGLQTGPRGAWRKVAGSPWR